MTPLAFPIGLPEMLIILVIIVVLFGGARLAGLGKSTGRAIREFKEETKGLGADDKEQSEVVDAEVVDPDPATKPQTPSAVEGSKPAQSNAAPSDSSQSSEVRRDS